MSQEPPETHHVLDMVYTPPLREFHMRRPSLVRRWARELDGIGVDLSKQVERRFPRPIDMTLASVQDWMEIPGVGKKKATSLVKDIQGES
jgi:NAD-dependent DNA ligase